MFTQELVNSLKDKFSKILHIRRENQPSIEGTIQITDNFRYIPKVLGCYLLQRGGMSRKDMSVSMQYATDSFTHLLNKQQKNKLDAAIKYSKGRFAFLTKDYDKSKNNLMFSVQYGSFLAQLKSLWMLIVIWSYK